MKLSEALVEVWAEIADPKKVGKEARDIYKALYKAVAELEKEGRDFNDDHNDGK